MFGELDSLLHEILHSKVPPDAVAKLDSPIDQLGVAVVNTVQEKSPEAWVTWKAELEHARDHASKVMCAFDNDLEDVLPENGW